MLDFACHLDNDLSLVAPHPRYADEVFKLIDANRDHLGRWFSWIADIDSAKPVKAHYAERCQQLALGTGGAWLIRWQDKIIGHIGITPRGDGHAGEIEYWFGSSAHEGKGIMTRCAQRVLEHGHAVGLKRVQICCSSKNERSRRVIERLPVEFEMAKKAGDPLPDGTVTDHLVWSSIRPDAHLTRQTGRPIQLLLPTERDDLKLAVMQKADVSPMFALVDANREHVGAKLPWVDKTHAPADTQTFVETIWKELAEGKGVGTAMLLDGKHVGCIGVHCIDDVGRAGEIGYWLAKEHEGKGLMTTAVRAIEQYAWTGYDLVRLMIRAEEDNPRSGAVAERCGFEREGVQRWTDMHRGKPGNLVVYGMVRPTATID